MFKYVFKFGDMLVWAQSSIFYAFM